MAKLIKHIYPFLIVLVLFIVSTGIFIFGKNKLEAHLLANQYHNTFLDYFFFYATQIVEVAFPIIVWILIMAFKSYKDGIILFSAFIISGLTTQVLKKTIYDDVQRPIAALGDQLRLIPDTFELQQRVANSFPSGHATAAFSMFIMLTIFSKDKKWGYIFGFSAVLVAYSRVYLSQHFFEDILVGSLIGTFVSLLIYYWLNRYSFGILGQYRIIGKINDTK